MQHTLEIESCNAYAKKQTKITWEVSFNDIEIHIRLIKWKYINDLMDILDGANNHMCTHPRRLGR